MSENLWPMPTMMLVSSGWAQMKSFSLVPVDHACPYIECLYNPTAKTLAIIGKTKKDTFHMIPRLGDTGESDNIKSGENAGQPKKQRVQQESWTEYYITERDEVENFIKRFAVNHEEFNYTKTLDMETMSTPSESGVTPGSKLIIER